MKYTIGIFTFLFSFLLLAITPASACTRAVYRGPDGLVITGRSMDWRDEIPANLWLFPRGMVRSALIPLAGLPNMAASLRVHLISPVPTV